MCLRSDDTDDHRQPGRLNISNGGSAFAVHINGGFEVVSGGGIDTLASVSAGAQQFRRRSGGNANSMTTILSGGKPRQTVRSGGTVSSALISGEQDLFRIWRQQRRLRSGQLHVGVGRLGRKHPCHPEQLHDSGGQRHRA